MIEHGAKRTLERMFSETFLRWSGPATMVGGLLWIVAAVVSALKPEGCVGAECFRPGRSMRASGTADAVLLIAAVLLIGLGAVAVAHVIRGGRFGRLARVGLFSSALGLVSIASGLLVQALFFGGDFPYMPLAVIPGALAVVIGLLLLGIAMAGSGVLSRWVGLLLIFGTLALLGFNDQNAQVLLAIPFGVAWSGVGYALWSAPAGQRLTWSVDGDGVTSGG
jgi:hypothetical protein